MLLSPIDQLIKLGGEPVTLRVPAVAPAPFDPRSVDDQAAPMPATFTTRGIMALPEDILAVGATDGVTILPDSVPANLAPQVASVDWHGQTWRVMRVRNRYWAGELSGYTLYLAA